LTIPGERIPLTKPDLARRIDSTALKPDAIVGDIDRLCDDAAKFNFWSVCVGPYFVRHASIRLIGTGVKTCTVIGFPSGFARPETKLFESRLAAEQGADEIDMVMNVSALKSKDYRTLTDEMESVASFCKTNGKLLKVILECCYLTNEEKMQAARSAEGAGADFVKTSTGFGTGGATVEDVRLLKGVLSAKTRIKAAGGIGTAEKAFEMINAGAERIGTSSGIKIMKEWTEKFGR
jgi:deoxyribose-phosphate aldolase